MLKKDKKIDYDNLNEVIDLSRKLLKFLIVILILASIMIFVGIFKELKILTIIGNILGVIAPFFIGLVVAWLFDPFVSYLQRRKIKRGLGATIVFVLFLGLLFLLFKTLIPLLIDQVNAFIKTVPNLILSISNFIHELFYKLSTKGIDLFSLEKNIYDSIEKLGVNLTTTIPKQSLNILSSCISSIGTFLIGLVVGFYLLIDFDSVKHVLDLIPVKYHKGLTKVCKKLNSTFIDFIQGTLFIVLIVSLISTLGYTLVGLPSPFLFGVLCGLTNIIPYIGPWVGGAICVIVGLNVSPVVGILAAVVALIVQQIDNILLQPLVMGKTMKLHPVTIMIGLLIFGYFFGILGMIFATPIISGLKIILNYFDEKYELMNKFKGVKSNENDSSN